jgi:hypothetical protein
MDRELRYVRLALAALLASILMVFGVGCTPAVGDACQLSTDCGSTGNLVCDTSQFDGYCTMLDCVPNECPNNAACVLFNTNVPGCGYNDRQQGSRISEQFCEAVCTSDSDCRVGYVCANPRLGPWFADILDNLQYPLVCLPAPPNGMVGGDSGPTIEPDAPVCRSTVASYDAFPPPPDAELSDAPDGE